MQIVSIAADTRLVTPKLFVTSAVKAGKLKPQLSHPPLQLEQPCDPDLALDVNQSLLSRASGQGFALLLKQMD